jgi:hypothetical protein
VRRSDVPSLSSFSFVALRPDFDTLEGSGRALAHLLSERASAVKEMVSLIFGAGVRKKVFLTSGKMLENQGIQEGMVKMADAVITEFAGTRKGPVTRFYQYGRDGVRVLDTGKNLKRLYLFGPSADMMTERDTTMKEKILRRFIFDQNGMLEETFSFGQRPRTFRYENGGRQIAVREGGQYGAVGKTFTFDHNGIIETAWGRDGEIERVYIFESGNDTITERAAGWYGPVSRTLVFEGIDASVFRGPEAFLQFMVFTEQGEEDVNAGLSNRTVDTHQGTGSSPARSRFAFTGKRHTQSDIRDTGEKGEDTRIDIIPDGDAAGDEPPSGESRTKKSSEISYAERRSGRQS